VAGAYARRFHVKRLSAVSVYALYGYAAMEDILAAIKKAGREASDRVKLLAVFFHHLGRIHDVIGSYTIDGNGDSSLSTFDGYRVTADGGLALLREIKVG
jgi:ABC-type branched-subunit amino acid transport system substrate-binding protein